MNDKHLASGPETSRRSNPASYRVRPRRVTRWTAGLGVATMLASGGAVLGANIAAASAASRPAAVAAPTPTPTKTKPPIPKPKLSTPVTAFGACLAKAGTAAAGNKARIACIAKLEAAYPGQHGTKTYKSGTFKVTYAWQRGTVSAVGTKFVSAGVTSTDKTAWTWLLGKGVRILKGGNPATAAATVKLKAPVFVIGVLVGTARHTVAVIG